MVENEWFSLLFSGVFITPAFAGGILSLFLSGKMAGVPKKKLGLPLFVLVINNIYSILKRVVQAVVGAMYCKLSQLLESNRFNCAVFARLRLSHFIY